MTGKDPTDDEVRKLIRESVEIVREDRERAHYAELHGKYGQQPEPAQAGQGDPPPAAEPKEEPKAEYGLWGRKRQ